MSPRLATSSGPSARPDRRPLAERLDEGRDYAVRTLPVLLWLTLLGSLASAALALASGHLITTAGIVAGAGVIGAALLLARRGRLQLATRLFIGDGVVLATYLQWTGDGLKDIAVMVYPVILIVGAMLLPGLAYAALLGLCLGSLLLIAGVRDVTLRDPAVVAIDVLYLVILLSVTATAVWLLASALRRSLREARTSARALAASEERYRLISEVSSDYTFSSRMGEDGRFHLEWVAGAFERITGYSLEEYEARGGWTATLHPEDVVRDTRDLAEVHANRPVVTEMRIITRSGEVRWVRVYAHPVWNDAENRLAGIYGAVQDVTEERQVVTEREALLRELEAKNAELERFSYTVSHDLKTPLITVQSFVGFLEPDAASGNLERLRADVARIRAATEKMLRMLNELLELSRVGRVASLTTEVRMGDLVQDALALVHGRLDQSGVVVEVAQDLPIVRGDRGRLLLVLQNLLDNAVKFMGAREQPRVEIGARHQNGRTVLYVRDNGIGIEPRHHDRVFGLFEKLDSASEGTGLGLALVRRIVETHQGKIWVESRGVGHGTTFCFTLGERGLEPPPGDKPTGDILSAEAPGLS